MTQYSKIFIAGANGMLGTTLQGLVDTSEHLLTDKDVEGEVSFCDIRDLKHTSEVVSKYKPDIILNFAALVDLEYCEQEKDDCYLTNTIAAIHLFNLARDLNVPYVFISTAGIFGNDKEYYTEEDTPFPLSAYGKSKYYTEQLMQNQGYEKYWIFRAGWMMGGGPLKDKKFVNKIMKQIKSGAKELNVVDDKLGASRYQTAVEMNEFLNLGVSINKVDSNFFAEEYSAPRPYSEKLINKSLNDLKRNYMRDWKTCLHEYLSKFYKNEN